MSIRTAEFVSPKHPDKICDFIADSILDAYLADDPESRVAVEVMGGHKLITINGEVTSRTQINFPNIEKIAQNIVSPDYKIISNIVAQSGEIARGVATGGAGDQGIMKGYATSETEEFLPLEYVLARDLCQKIYEVYPYDGKTQVTIDLPAVLRPALQAGGYKILTVVASFQNAKTAELLNLVKKIMAEDLPAEALARAGYLINPAGEWHQGGFDADTGVSGRKIIIDNYGPEIAVGGGSFSGKDYTKVDRSGAYMARKIAVDYLKKYQAKEVFTKLAYAIGKSEPVMAVAVVYPEHGRGDGKEMPIEGYDLTPRGIREYLKLDKVKFAETSNWGHFGRGFSWQ